MMYYARVAWTKFRSPEKHIMIQPRGHHEALKPVGAIGRNFERRRHLHDIIWLAALPTCGEYRRRRLGTIAFRSSRNRPFLQRRDLRIRQTPLMREAAVAGLGFPGRHVALLGRNGDQA